MDIGPRRLELWVPRVCDIAEQLGAVVGDGDRTAMVMVQSEPVGGGLGEQAADGPLAPA
jgi:hypothetical protein